VSREACHTGDRPCQRKDDAAVCGMQNDIREMEQHRRSAEERGSDRKVHVDDGTVEVRQAAECNQLRRPERPRPNKPLKIIVEEICEERLAIHNGRGGDQGHGRKNPGCTRHG